jgi:hypothetical protein
LVHVFKWAGAQPADDEKAKTDWMAAGLKAEGFAVGQGPAPHFFEIVVAADFGPEEVHDDVACVD